MEELQAQLYAVMEPLLASTILLRTLSACVVSDKFHSPPAVANSDTSGVDINMIPSLRPFENRAQTLQLLLRLNSAVSAGLSAFDFSRLFVRCHTCRLYMTHCAFDSHSRCGLQPHYGGTVQRYLEVSSDEADSEELSGSEGV